MTKQALRAILQRGGSSDVRLELHRDSDVNFSIFVNGELTAEDWIVLTPLQVMTGVGPQRTIHDVWQSILAKRFPDYTVTAFEEPD